MLLLNYGHFGLATARCFKEFSTNKPRMVHYKHSERPDHEAGYTFDLKIAQDRTLSFSIILS